MEASEISRERREKLERHAAFRENLKQGRIYVRFSDECFSLLQESMPASYRFRVKYGPLIVTAIGLVAPAIASFMIAWWVFIPWVLVAGWAFHRFGLLANRDDYCLAFTYQNLGIFMFLEKHPEMMSVEHVEGFNMLPRQRYTI